jgi:hypothetical protein
MPYAFHPRPRSLAIKTARLQGGAGTGLRGIARLGELTATTPTQTPLTPWNNPGIGAAPSTNPLAYVTPQMGIAAGLDASKVYAAWRELLAEYPTAQLAIAAGIPAGVVQELWVQPPAAVPWAEQIGPFGLKKGVLAALAAAAFVFLDSQFGDTR